MLVLFYFSVRCSRRQSSQDLLLSTFHVKSPTLHKIKVLGNFVIWDILCGLEDGGYSPPKEFHALACNMIQFLAVILLLVKVYFKALSVIWTLTFSHFNPFLTSWVNWGRIKEKVMVISMECVLETKRKVKEKVKINMNKYATHTNHQTTQSTQHAGGGSGFWVSEH